MKRIGLLCLSLSLVGCVHGRGTGPVDVYTLLNGDKMGVAVRIAQPVPTLDFIAGEAEALTAIFAGPAKGEAGDAPAQDWQQKVESELGFNPLTTVGWGAMGLDPNRPTGMVFRGVYPDVFTEAALPVADREKFMATLKKVADKLSIAMGTPVSTPHGDWIGFSRSTGQKSEAAGGILFHGDYALVTQKDRESLRPFAKGPSVAENPYLAKLSGAAEQPGHIDFLMLPKWVMELPPKSSFSRSTGEAVFGSFVMRSGQEISGQMMNYIKLEDLASMQAISPAPQTRVAPVKDPVIAGVFSLFVPAMIEMIRNQRKTDPKLEEIFKASEKAQELLKEPLSFLGHDWALSIGIDGEPSNPMVLLGSIFVRLEVGGGQPQQALKGIVSALGDLGVNTKSLREAEGGYDLFIPPMVLIRIRADEGSLSLSYGKEAELDPGGALMKLAQDNNAAAVIDLAKLGRIVRKSLPPQMASQARIAGAIMERYGWWESWSKPTRQITSGFLRIKITP